MFEQKGLMVEKRGRNGGLVAVAIDKDKGSQYALKWAVDNLLQRGQSIILIHVKLKQSSSLPPTSSLPSPRLSQFDAHEEYGGRQIDAKTRELFLPFRCFCSRKDIQCKDVMVEDVEVVKGLVEFVNQAAIEHLVIGTPSKSGFLRRFREKDIPNNASKMAPDYCTIYIISKGKLTSTRPASRAAPSISPLHNQLVSQIRNKSEVSETYLAPPTLSRPQRPQLEPIRNFNEATESMRSPLTRVRGYTGKSHGELSIPDSDISFVSSGRQNVDRLFPSFYDNMDAGRSPRLSTGSDRDYYGSDQFGRRSMDVSSPTAMSLFSQENDRMPWSSQDDVEAEMRRLKQELKQTMDMYSTACKEALTAKQKATELQHWKLDEVQRLEKARMAEEAALAIAEREKAKSRAAIEAAKASQKIAELEVKKRINAESKAMLEAEEKKKVLDALAQTDVRYRKYSIEEIESATEHFNDSRKIGEGGYGPVYKCYLDHTSVAIKVLRPDAAQGRSQFQQEVEVLSNIRHPNMVLLLGACPEYGCLVYEYMPNGSLDDRLFCRQNTPPLSWQLRFKIAAEIGTGLLFLHQTKPEPLVHRDLKPGNILLDRNFVSKISDVGLARLVPPSVSDTVTQYRMTSTAGTFCYIDPEYQQTGMLGLKSDIYSLGIMFLQLITAKPPMGLTHHVGRAIENGTLAQLLDPNVPDWPMEEVTGFAKMALKCAELRRKDRPDLGTVVLPKLNRLRDLSEDDMNLTMSEGSSGPSLKSTEVLVRPDVMSEHHIPQSEAKSGGSASF